MGLNILKINKFFQNIGQKIIRFRWMLLIIFLLLVVYSLTGLKKLKLDSSNDAWFFDHDEIVITEKRFENIFGNSDIAVIHLSNEKIMTQKNLELIQQITDELERKVPLVDDVISITNLEYIKGTDWGIDIGNLSMLWEDLPLGADMSFQEGIISFELWIMFSIIF